MPPLVKASDKSSASKSKPKSSSSSSQQQNQLTLFNNDTLIYTLLKSLYQSNHKENKENLVVIKEQKGHHITQDKGPALCLVFQQENILIISHLNQEMTVEIDMKLNNVNNM
jgi:hypothetical protein